MCGGGGVLEELLAREADRGMCLGDPRASLPAMRRVEGETQPSRLGSWRKA